MTSPMTLVVRIRSDTDGPNRLPGKSRLTLLRSNTGMSSAGFGAAWRGPRLRRAELRPRGLLGGLGLVVRRGPVRVGDHSAAASCLPPVAVLPCPESRGSVSRESVSRGTVSLRRLHVAPVCGARRVSRTTVARQSHAQRLSSPPRRCDACVRWIVDVTSSDMIPINFGTVHEMWQIVWKCCYTRVLNMNCCTE